MANGNYTYCPIAGSLCTRACRFFGQDDNECLIEDTLLNLCSTAERFILSMEREEADWIDSKKRNDGDTPEPHETKQKEV